MLKQMNNVTMHKATNNKPEKVESNKPVNHVLNLLPMLYKLKLRCNSYKILVYIFLLNMLCLFLNIFLFSLYF